MSDEQGAATPSDGPAASSAPAESEQAKPAPATQQESAAPDAETKPEGDGHQAQEEAEDRPKKPSRYDRMKRRMTAMATELDNLRAQLGTGSQAAAKDDAPKEADFNGDYFAFQNAKLAYDARQAVREEFATEHQRRETERVAELRREMAEEFEERTEDFRSRIPDFDQAIQKFVTDGGKFSPALVEELQASEMGPALAYQLVKNPLKAAELNAMSPREVAREIGRLEAKTSLPKPKTATKAPPPIAPLSGGALPPQDLASLAKSTDASAYIAARRQAARAKS